MDENFCDESPWLYVREHKPNHRFVKEIGDREAIYLTGYMNALHVMLEDFVKQHLNSEP